MWVKILGALLAMALIIPYEIAAFQRGPEFKPRAWPDTIPDHLAVLGLTLLVLVLVTVLTNRARKHAEQPAYKMVLLGSLFGVSAGLITSLAYPPVETDSTLLIYRFERVLILAGLVGCGIYIMLRLVADQTNGIFISRTEEVLALMVAFSAVFICGIWISMEIGRVGKVVSIVTYGLIDWIGAGVCESHRNPDKNCAEIMKPRGDIPHIAAAMLGLYFFFVALWESRRWRLSFVRSVIILGSMVCAGFLLLGLVNVLIGEPAPAEPPQKNLLTLGALLLGMAIYASLFSFWMTWSRHHSLVEALCEAFGSTDSFRAMVEARLKPRFEIPPRSDSLEGEVRAVVDRSKRNGWLQGLVVNARYSRPQDLKLARIADRLGVGIAPPKPENIQTLARRIQNRAVKPDQDATETFEKMIRQFNQLSPEQRRKREAELEARVCCIVTPRNAGTGWLVGPDLVLTNYHVVMDMIGDNPLVTPADVECRFDYKESLGDNYTRYRLHPKLAIVDWSPFNTSDGTDSDDIPRLDELDFALLRLRDRAGELPIGVAVGTDAEPGAPFRGWISLKSALEGRDPDEHLVGDKTQLYVLQHPYAGRLKGEIGSVTMVNSNGTRIRHEATTDGGSSGSPCFNFSDLTPLALHHAGKHSKTLQSTYNQAVPISRIVKLIRDRGKSEPFWQMSPGRPSGSAP